MSAKLPLNSAGLGEGCRYLGVRHQRATAQIYSTKAALFGALFPLCYNLEALDWRSNAMNTKTNLRFFITHSWFDNAFAEKLCDDLRSSGFGGFLDVYSIHLGDDIPREINQGLEKCDVYIPVLSSSALRSKWCEHEINAAIVLSKEPERRGRPIIIPVLAEDCRRTLPPLLKPLRYVNFVGRYASALQELLAGIFALQLEIEAGTPVSYSAIPSVSIARSTIQWPMLMLIGVVILAVLGSAMGLGLMWGATNRSTPLAVIAASTVETLLATPAHIISTDTVTPQMASTGASLASPLDATPTRIQTPRPSTAIPTRPSSTPISKVISVANAASVKELFRLEGHESHVQYVDFSPDGKFLASSSTDGTVRVWDIGSARQIFTLDYSVPIQGASPTNAVVFATNGRIAVYGSKQVNERWQDIFEVWDFRSQQKIADLPRGDSQGLIRDPNGKLLSTDCQAIWDASTLQKINQVPPIQSSHCLFKPNEKLISYVPKDGSLEFWDPYSQTQLSSLAIPSEDSVYDWSNVAISSDGSLIAYGWVPQAGNVGATRIWRTNGWQMLAEFQSGKSDRLAFSSDNSLLAIGSDKEIQLWDVGGKRKLATLTGLQFAIRGMEFSPDGRLLATGDEPTIKIWGIP